jgi:hypothetical protein
MALYWTGTAAELGSYPPNANRSLLEWACGTMAGSATGLQAYMALMQPLAPGQCLNMSWSQECYSGNDDGDEVAVSANRGGYCATHFDDPTSDCQDGWGIESCTTEIHP